MNDTKYIGMDVHTATISAAVRDSSGNLVMEATLETKAETILEFVHGLRGSLRVSFEEGTCAAWLHDLLKPHVTEVLVCDSRKNALLRVGNKNDREDARKLSELLFLNKLHPVYHGETGIRTLKELARRRSIEVGGLLVPASKCMHLATVPNGSRRSAKPACAVAPRSTISSSMS